MKADTARDHRQRILRVLVHVEAHLDHPLGLEELARIACFSPFHFHRVFRAVMGENLHEHVRRLRLERAAHELRHSRARVLAIALGAGYESNEAFTRAFQQRFGVSPSAWRSGRAKAAPFRRARPRPLQDVRLETRAPLRVAFMRHVGAYSEVGGTWSRFVGWAWPRGLVGRSPFIGIVHDDPGVTMNERIRYDACLGAPESVRAEGDVGVRTIEGGTYAVVTHRGPYVGLIDTYSRLYARWLPESGRTLRPAPGFESYRNSPRETRPEDLLTDIYLPIE